MIRFYLRLMLIPLLLFSIIILLMQIEPYDDHEIRELVLPDGCSEPCFLGIRPGVTTTGEALQILESNAWINEVKPSNARNPYQIWWTWSETVPDFLKSTPTNSAFPVNGGILSSGGIVSSIVFATRLSLGDIALTWGYPSSSQLIFPGLMIAPNESIAAVFTLDYTADGFVASGVTHCPYTTQIWHTPAQVRMTSDERSISLGTVMQVERENILVSIRHTSHMMCGA